MVVSTPIVLSGSNLKERHRHLNELVQKAFEENLPIQDVINLPEYSPIDRIFKIDLASKYRCMDYILENLKDDYMLYVSRCLKCFWLLEPQYSSIFNPSYLETNVYPEMILPAVNKMKHWLHLNLKDTERNCEFYIYYKANFDYAVNFFWRCSKEFILSEFPNIVDKLSHQQIKLIFESCPDACPLYFEILPTNKLAIKRYIADESKYFKNVKYLLKPDTNKFLDIYEKYFNKHSSEPFNSTSTQYVLKNYKPRIVAKIEFYASYLLHMETLAATMDCEEAKELVLKLARASYLENWFTYKAVEPLIKRVKIEERSKFKKLIFIDKCIGSKVETWPYEVPEPLKLEEEEQNDILQDVEHKMHFRGKILKRIMKRKYAKYYACDMISAAKSPLDMLFDQYRFSGFEKTFSELKAKLSTQSAIQGRMNIMLVLVSKSGGVPEQVEKLLSFLVQKHINEPTHLRVAVIRSFVNRQCIWRLPEKTWNLLLEFSRDLGLDGQAAEQFCCEGLHAVVIRHLISDTPIPESILAGFLREYSLLTEYKLSKDEKMVISKRLPPLFLPSNPNAFINALTEYKVSVDEFPEAKPILVKLAHKDSDLVKRLYDNRMLRRELFREIFNTEKTEAAYINVLRHDVSPLDQGKAFVSLIQEKGRLKYDKFLQSISLYFSEPDGLAQMHKKFLEEQMKLEPKPLFARPLCILSTDKDLISQLVELDNKSESEKSSQTSKQVAAAFRANVHKTKPPLRIEEHEWRWLGAKAVANKVLISRSTDRPKYIKKLLEWRRTANISFRLAYGTDHAVDNFIQLCELRPISALKVVLNTFFTQKNMDPRVWTAVKSIIEKIDISKNDRLFKKLNNPSTVPRSIETDYHIVMFKTYLKHDKKFIHLNYLKNHLSEVDKSFIHEIAKEFIKCRLNPVNWVDDDRDVEYDYMCIISQCLLLSESQEEQKSILDNICEPFFDSVQSLSPTKKENELIRKYLNEFIFSLKYTKSFLGKEYINLLPVFERILKRLHKILPTQEYFAKYAEIHLTMLYYKTLRQIVQVRPDLFEDLSKTKECVEVVGKLFGKYIGYEVKELILKYFHSIVYMYRGILKKYLEDYFAFARSKNRGLFEASVIKGLLDVKSTEAIIIAQYLFKESHHFIEESSKEEIVKAIVECNDSEVKYILGSDVFPTIYSYN